MESSRRRQERRRDHDATAHARKAVGGVAEVHFVRMDGNPFRSEAAGQIAPIAEAINCIMITHTMAARTDCRSRRASVFAQGEMDDKAKSGA